MSHQPNAIAQGIWVQPDQAIVCQTDLKGNITYVNPCCIQVSGY